MEWGKLYAGLPDDPRVQAAEDDGGAGWLLVESMCYCTRAEPDGFIPDTQVRRFGSARIRQRVAALVREDLWIRTKDGYLLDPRIWSEERNLSDQAERKREADRLRVAAKRAAARAAQDEGAADVSRDSSATGDAALSADSGGDSRGAEKNRQDLPPSAPQATGCSRHRRARRNCPGCARPPLAPVPPKCGSCNPSRHLEDPVTGDDLGRCPACHPSIVRSAS